MLMVYQGIIFWKKHDFRYLLSGNEWHNTSEKQQDTQQNTAKIWNQIIDIKWAVGNKILHAFSYKSKRQTCQHPCNCLTGIFPETDFIPLPDQENPWQEYDKMNKVIQSYINDIIVVDCTAFTIYRQNRQQNKGNRITIKQVFTVPVQNVGDTSQNDSRIC